MLLPTTLLVCLVPFAIAQVVSSQPVAEPPAASQQTATQSATSNSTAEGATRVVLDVVVTNAKGNVVTGLTRDDFKVTDAQEPQTLTAFDISAAHSTKPAVTIHSTAELDRLAPDAPVNIILLDEFNTLFQDQAFARYSLEKYLEKQPARLTAPTMLLAVGIDKFTVLNDYTQDKQAILRALEYRLAENPWRNHSKSWAPERLGTAFMTLERVAEATVNHPGHKNMIWIGRGFPSIDMARIPIDSSRRVESYVQQCVNMLRDARVTFYAVDPAEQTVDPIAKYGNEGADQDPFGGNYDFSGLARATGGKSIYGKNDVDAEIGTSARDGENFYTLTYRPATGAIDPQKFRKIAVTVDRPGLMATTRLGYFDLNSASSSTMTNDAVPLTLTPDSKDRDSFQLRIDAKGLVWTSATHTEPRHANFVYETTTFDRKGKELKKIAHVVESDAPTILPPQGRLEMPVTVPIKLDYDARAVRLRIVVRITQTGREGTADAVLQ